MHTRTFFVLKHERWLLINILFIFNQDNSWYPTIENCKDLKLLEKWVLSMVDANDLEKHTCRKKINDEFKKK